MYANKIKNLKRIYYHYIRDLSLNTYYKTGDYILNKTISNSKNIRLINIIFNTHLLNKNLHSLYEYR